MPVYFKGSKITPIVKDTSLFKKLVDRSITAVTAEDLQGVTSIESYAFFGCSGLTSVTIGNGVTRIRERAFAYCSVLTSVTIGNGVTSIGSSAFQYCRVLYNLIIGSSVTSIGNYAFYACNALRSITFPDTITSIGNYAFAATGLKSVTINAITPPTLSDAFTFDGTNCLIYVPAASVDAYKAATNWSTLADRIFAIS